jgi:hypothetical protein
MSGGYFRIAKAGFGCPLLAAASAGSMAEIFRY